MAYHHLDVSGNGIMGFKLLARKFEERSVFRVRLAAILLFLFAPGLLIGQVSQGEIPKKKTREKEYRKLQKELASEIPSKTRRQFLKSVLPAIERGSNQSVISSMLPLIATRSKKAIAAVDTYCIQLGYGSILDFIQDQFIQAVEQGRKVNHAGMTPQLRAFLLDGLIKEIDEQLEELSSHSIMKDDLKPSTHWQSSEQLFWEVHVWKNRLENLDRLSRQAVVFASQDLEKAIKKNDQKAIAYWKRPQQKSERIRETFKNLSEREIEIRILEIPMAEKVLREPSSFEDKIHAAFQLEMHAEVLGGFFARLDADSKDVDSNSPQTADQKPLAFQRELLNDRAVLKSTRQLIKSARTSGEDVIQKAILLKVGAHWWLRGRYGMAPLSSGLLKPESALKSSQQMFGLYMPKERPQPIGMKNETSGEVSPGHLRRHFYTWAVERQEVQIKGISTSKTEHTGRVTFPQQNEFFY